MTLIEMEVAELTLEQQKHYHRCLGNGCSQRMALMLASKHGPEMGESDRTFNEGARSQMSNMADVSRKRMLEIANQAGINTDGKYYVGGLGKYNDPHAWVSTADDVRTVLKKKNLNAEGLITHKAASVDPVSAPPLSSDLVREYLSQEVSRIRAERGPSFRLTKKQVGELREKVIDVHGRKPRRKSCRASALKVS